MDGNEAPTTKDNPRATKIRHLCGSFVRTSDGASDDQIHPTATCWKCLLGRKIGSFMISYLSVINQGNGKSLYREVLMDMLFTKFTVYNYIGVLHCHLCVRKGIIVFDTFVSPCLRLCEWPHPLFVQGRPAYNGVPSTFFFSHGVKPRIRSKHLGLRSKR